jgi:hypothetical protein
MNTPQSMVAEVSGGMGCDGPGSIGNCGAWWFLLCLGAKKREAGTTTTTEGTFRLKR